jgi:hypothetical protein
VELAKTRLAGKRLTDLIAPLQEPQESEEFRLKILEADFKTCGTSVIEQLQEFVGHPARLGGGAQQL